MHWSRDLLWLMSYIRYRLRARSQRNLLHAIPQFIKIIYPKTGAIYCNSVSSFHREVYRYAVIKLFFSLSFTSNACIILSGSVYNYAIAVQQKLLRITILSEAGKLILILVANVISWLNDTRGPISFYVWYVLINYLQLWINFLYSNIFCLIF